jgi:penicillin-binding protein 1B
LRIRLARGFWTSRFGLTVLGIAVFALLGGAGLLTYYYIRFGHLIDERLSGQVFQNTSRVYSAPRRIFVGEPLRPSDLTVYLAHTGYSTADVAGSPGRYRATGSLVEIHPSANSFFEGGDALRVEFANGGISRILTLPDGASQDSGEIEPELLTNLFDSSREKRRVIQFQDLPKVLVDAVLSAEDKRFFEHPGFDPVRVIGAAWADIRHGAKAQGASTIDMQVARNFFFSAQRTWRRKLAETLVALELEQRFSKPKIFELYANEVYLGNRGSFAIRGFGEGAEAYFGKDVRQLTAGEAAFLAGIIRAPNRYSSAERHPERAVEARDRVLAQMVENQDLSAPAAEAAKRERLRIVSGGLESSSAPYFVDMVKDHLLERFSEADLTAQSLRIYTTLDPQLQRAADEAVGAGVKNVDALLARRYAVWKKRGESAPRAQVAVVVLDPHSGAILALTGGRNYGESQLNRAQARRQPGSSFKPFVYAAALDNAAEGLQPSITPITTVVDEPTTFTFDNKEYTPNNYGEQFFGTVTVRDALTHSLNVATVKVAELVGYQRVLEVVRQMGLDPNIQATPAMALGAYEMTPFEVAAGYTIFATDGMRAEPMFLTSVIDSDRKALERVAPRTRPALDPRVAYLVTNLMEDVINRGTGAVVRARGFTAPAAGKTGTSRDGWFAGFTSNLLCVVWVGFDDNRDLGLSGAATAGPIWAEFMKRATALPSYHSTQPFAAPPGVVQVLIDSETGDLATPACPATRNELFIAGTEPTQFCPMHGGHAAAVPPVSWLQRLFGKSQPQPPLAPQTGARPGENTQAASPTEKSPSAPKSPSTKPSPPKQPPANEANKKGHLRRIFGSRFRCSGGIQASCRSSG